MAITKAALARSIDVLALTTKEQTYRCWDTEWPSKSEDIPRVRHPAGLSCTAGFALDKGLEVGDRRVSWEM